MCWDVGLGEARPKELFPTGVTGFRPVLARARAAYWLTFRGSVWVVLILLLVAKSLGKDIETDPISSSFAGLLSFPSDLSVLALQLATDMFAKRREGRTGWAFKKVLAAGSVVPVESSGRMHWMGFQEGA